MTNAKTTRRMIAPSPMMSGIKLRNGDDPTIFLGEMFEVGVEDGVGSGARYSGGGSGGGVMPGSGVGSLATSIAPERGVEPKSLVGSGNLGMVLSYQT